MNINHHEKDVDKIHTATHYTFSDGRTEPIAFRYYCQKCGKTTTILTADGSGSTFNRAHMECLKALYREGRI